MQTRSIELKSGLSKTVLAVICVCGIALALIFAKWAFGHAVAVNAVKPEVTALGVDLAASDPSGHFNFAQQLEKTLLHEDQQRSLAEYESAVALSPHNYIYWLGLARAREQAGDDGGAEGALREAQELAPNYSRVQWALGNFLLRRGQRNEGFEEIRKAVAADEAFAAPAAAAAWQIFEGDIQQIHAAVGDSPRINAAIAVLLAGDKRYPQAMDFWRRASAGGSLIDRKAAGQALYTKLLNGGTYRSAIEVAGDVGLFPNWDVSVGAVSNGGFETGLHSLGDGSHPFSWVVADGSFPRIGQNMDQKRSGTYSLLISFGQGGSGQRPVSQKIGVEPEAVYDLQFYYRSDVTTSARLRCDVLTASGAILAGAVLPPAGDWAQMKIPISVPANTEGIEIRIAMDGCSANGCTASGNVWFDDFALSKH